MRLTWIEEFDVESYNVYENGLPLLAARQFLIFLKAFGYQLLVDSSLSSARLQRSSGILLDLMQRFIALDGAKGRDPDGYSSYLFSDIELIIALSRDRVVRTERGGLDAFFKGLYDTRDYNVTDFPSDYHRYADLSVGSMRA